MSAEGVVSVEEKDHKFTLSVRAGEHQWTADEPLALGGKNSGPSPYDQLLGALGSCTAMTLRMYASHKKFPLEHISVSLKHSRIYLKDCEDCGSETQTASGSAMIDLIERDIRVRGALTEEQRQALLRIADRCPVHKTLMGEKKIRTQVVQAN